MNYIGCDLHKSSTYFYVIDVKGKCIINKSISNNVVDLHNFLKSVPKPFELAVEATYNWYFFIDIVSEYTDKYYLTNPLYLKAFAKRNKKTDKIDAYKLALYLKMQIKSKEQ